MGNKCCGNRKKPSQKQEENSEWTTKDSSQENTDRVNRGRTGKCPYCCSVIEIPLNLKYLECSKCKEKSMQDGCTNTLYKYLLYRLPASHCLRLQGK